MRESDGYWFFSKPALATRQTRVLCAVANSVATLCQRMSRLLRAEDGFAACADFNRLLLHRRLRGTNFLTGLLFLADNFFQACVNKIAKTNNAEFVACPFISFLRILFALLKINGAANKSELVVQPYRVFGASPCKAEPYFSAGLSRLAFCG